MLNLPAECFRPVIQSQMVTNSVEEPVPRASIRFAAVLKRVHPGGFGGEGNTVVAKFSDAAKTRTFDEVMLSEVCR